MNGLDALARGHASELGRLGRAALFGLRAMLRAGLGAAAEDDAARPACIAALANLDALLDEATPAASAPSTSPPREPALPSADPWQDLLRRWSGTPEWKTILGEPRLDGTGPDLPRRLAALVWRLPVDKSEAWRGQFPTVAGEEPPRLVAGPSQAILLPAMPTAPAPVWLSPDAPLDERLDTQGCGEIAFRAAPVVSACLWFSENDPTLSHLVRSVFRFGLSPLNETQLPRYQKALTERFERLRDAEREGDGAGLALAWVDLDEAVNGLLHHPPAHAHSLFASLGRASRELLGPVRAVVAQQGATAHFQVLSGKHLDLRGATEADADIEMAFGPPGEVVHCSRVFCKLGGKAMPGRVVYRPR